MHSFARSVVCGHAIFRHVSTLLTSSRSARSLSTSGLPAAQLASTPRSLCTQISSRFPLQDLPSISKHSSPLIFISTSNNSYYNLAIEDYILRNSSHDSHLLFFYTNRPCVVIGRNQNPWLECNLKLIERGLQAEDEEHKDAACVPIDLVRRKSGGGTVFHDGGNLNYSVIVPNDTNFRRAKHAEMVVRGLNSMRAYEFKAGIKVNERNDIVMKREGQEEWLKISGSAFKLIRGRALHHGTLLYSSPYLGKISGLLRSPGRAMIKAKGVESVRSPVGNLHWLADVKKREILRDMIVDIITAEFRSLYGKGTGQVITVGDQDVAAKENQKISNGASEMLQNEWRFEQTPRFTFESGLVGGEDIQFDVSRGMLERKKTSLSNGIQEKINSSGLRLHAVEDWNKALDYLLGDRAPRSDAMIERMSELFPCWK